MPCTLSIKDPDLNIPDLEADQKPNYMITYGFQQNINRKDLKAKGNNGRKRTWLAERQGFRRKLRGSILLSQLLDRESSGACNESSWIVVIIVSEESESIPGCHSEECILLEQEIGGRAIWARLLWQKTKWV
jgi:hypothetical protein